MEASAKLVRNILAGVQKLDPVGSLENLRRVLKGMSFETLQEEKLAKSLVAQAHLCCFNLVGLEAGRKAASLFSEADNQDGLARVCELVGRYSRKAEKPLGDRSRVNKSFLAYCETHGLVVIRILQEGIDSVRCCSWVYLVWDIDGIVKIFKEVLDYNDGPLGAIFDLEDDLYARLPSNPYLPRYYGSIEVGGTRFLRLSVDFGQTLSTGQPMRPTDVRWIIQGVSQAVCFLHANDIAYLDIKPENVQIGLNEIRLLDLGVSRKVQGGEEIDIYLADPRFGTPEGGARLKGSKASDIFQLGILYQLLLTGRHPFDLVPLQADEDSRRESAALRYFWPTTVLSYPVQGDGAAVLIAQMLERDPQKRPDIKEVVERLAESSSQTFVPRGFNIRSEREVVLFPARMGIPHKGHIEYITRLLRLGYHVLISVQRANTLMERDPIPKGLVVKMVAQSLADRGFVVERDFSFVLTPYGSLAEMEYHFSNLPRRQEVVAVASGNPEVHSLFSGWPIFDQKSVFGAEGEEWQDLSWGEILRRAVKEGDYTVFLQYAASGVERIIPFQELRARSARPQIEVARTVEAVLVQGSQELARGRVFRYEIPEQSLARHIQSLTGRKVEVVDLYARETELKIDGQPAWLVYEGVDFEPRTGVMSVRFTLKGIEL